MTPPPSKKPRTSYVDKQFDEGLKDLSDLRGKPRPIVGLCNFIALGLHDDVIRHLAASELLGRILETWSCLTKVDRAIAMQSLLQTISNEPNKPIKNVMVKCVFVVFAKEDGVWEELLPVLLKLVKSDDWSKKEIGVHILCTLAKVYPRHLSANCIQVCEVMCDVLKEIDLQDWTNSPLAAYAEEYFFNLATMMNFNAKDKNKEVSYVGVAITILMNRAIHLTLVRSDEKLALKTMDTITALLEHYHWVFTSQIFERLEELSLPLTRDELQGEQVRRRAFSVLEIIIKTAPENQYSPNINEIFRNFRVALSETPEERVERGEDDDTFEIFLMNKLDSISDYLRLKESLPLFDIVESCINSAFPGARRAAQVALGAMVKGRRLHVSRDINKFLGYTVRGIRDEHSSVQFAGLRNLSKFVLNLDNLKSRTIIPVLMALCGNCQIFNRKQYLKTLSDCLKTVEVPPMSRPTLMNMLQRFVNSDNSAGIRAAALVALKEAAFTIGVDMVPLIPGLLEVLKSNQTDDPDHKLKSIGLLHALVCSVRKKPEFTGLFKETVSVAMNIINSFEDDCEQQMKAHKLFSFALF